MNEVAAESAQAVQRRPRSIIVAGTVFSAVLALIAGALFNVGGLGSSYDRLAREVGLPELHAADDSDGDGLPDYVETDGWKSIHDGHIVTDPHKADTDGDGLTDGLEAGAPSSDTASSPVYASVSDPNDADTDADGVSDGDEYFMDMDPRHRDTDSDGLEDGEELDFGSDPTLGNPDGDSFSDEQELERGSDPMIYDLGRVEAIAALVAGATAGDWEWGARHAGINDAQFESPEYLTGQLASGYLGFGDIRDIAANAADGQLIPAVVSAVALAPFAGDSAKTVAVLRKFAKRGDRAKAAVSAVIARLPWSEATKKKAIRKIFGARVRLPAALADGPKNNTVYTANRYVGITDDFARRKSQHASNRRKFTPIPMPGASGLTRGEARAIEEACIVLLGMRIHGGDLENQRHSINPKLPYYDDALTYGKKRLRELGTDCT